MKPFGINDSGTIGDSNGNFKFSVFDFLVLAIFALLFSATFDFLFSEKFSEIFANPWSLRRDKKWKERPHGNKQ